jgi:hypothetical protein
MRLCVLAMSEATTNSRAALVAEEQERSSDFIRCRDRDRDEDPRVRTEQAHASPSGHRERDARGSDLAAPDAHSILEVTR